MTFIDYFLGQPTQYDNNNQVVKRDFGIQNLLLIVFTAYVLYNLFGKNKNQRGGGDADWNPREAFAMPPGARSARWINYLKDFGGPLFITLFWFFFWRHLRTREQKRYMQWYVVGVAWLGWIFTMIFYFHSVRNV